VSFHFAALHYLNLWLAKEQRIHIGFQEHEPRKRLAAIAAGAAHFRVARTLPKMDEERERYRGVLDILDGIKLEDVKETPVHVVSTITSEISSKYRNASVLSFTTKMLWLKFRSPIIIFDRQASNALKLKTSDFTEYWNRWQERFQQQQAEIEGACCLLVNVLPYVVDTSVTESEVQALSRERSFHERVFDSYLWHHGSR
jgi:hypothetical protein